MTLLSTLLGSTYVGNTGATGPTGANGSNGVQGASGSTGTAGTNGASGATGTQGASGSTGPTGAQGASGSTGTQGASGPGYTTSTVAQIASIGLGGANVGATGSVYALNSLGVGTTPSGVAGEIRAANNVTAYYTSDIKFKENVRDIPDALNKVLVIGGKLFDWTDEYIAQHGGLDNYFMRKSDLGVIAQDVQAVLPVAVREKEDGTLAVDYEKLCALAFAAIKEQQQQIEELKIQVQNIK
jgi:hypothetical protein